MTLESTAAEQTPSEQHSSGHTGYRLVIEPSAKRIQAFFNGREVADSRGVLVMHETHLPAVYYFPRADVRMELLERTDKRTYCPFKGNASYWSLSVGEQVAENAVWSYEAPFDESAMVGDYVAFYWDALDTWLADDCEIAEQPQTAGLSAVNPLVDWLVHGAWRAASTEDLVRQLVATLGDAGMPITRLRLLIQTLNPQLFALTYTWRWESDQVTVFEATHAGLQSAQFRDSPFAVVLDGEGGVRRRLDVANPRLDYPILEDLVADGATDYVAMPLTFCDGQINIITLVSHQAGGFSVEHLGCLYEILPNLSRLLEAHAERVTRASLLKTYLGNNAGEQVMNGLVKRGDGADLHAAIWLGDLRGSTAMAERLGREDYLATINQFFDCMAGAVMDQGGEVLKFIGDAVLAMFPIDDPRARQPEACERALAAVHEAEQRIQAANRAREGSGIPPLAFGVGLHRGNLTFGNVGTDRRLDFTVIGSAVNVASRIEDLCKRLDRPVLMSSVFAASIDSGSQSLGSHWLRGLDAKQEIFAPAAAKQLERPAAPTS